MDERDNELAAAFEAAARKKKINTMLIRIQQDESLLTERIKSLEAVLGKEEKDVDRLENGSITALFWSVLGKRDERIDKEREEALAARLKYDQAQKELEDMENRAVSLNAELKALDGCEERYTRLFEEKRQFLLDEHGEAGRRLLNLMDDIARAQSNIKEIREAADAGKRALELLDSALGSLKKAEGWGRYDILGGGVVAGMVKHDHIDEAAAYASRAQMEMNAFKTELADVNLSGELTIQISDFTRFADLFFDSMIADMHVLDAIEETEDSVAAARAEVASVKKKLNSLYGTERERIKRLESEMETLVIGG